MTPELLQKAKEALDHALRLNPQHQHEFREQLHRDEPEIAKEFDELLRQHSDASLMTVAVHSTVQSSDETIDHDRESAETFVSSAQVHGYEILGELGRGGMGVVYKAKHIGLKRLVALKMILAGEHAGASQFARFRDEAESVARLQHPNIVQIYEIGEHEGLPYFSLEFCDGGSLHDMLDGTPWKPKRAAELVMVLAKAMHAAHEANLVHRDLKPRNILRLSDGTPKIADFGLAKKLDEADGQTATGAIVGTPSYMAPEQANENVKSIGPTVDVYALGVILYELVVGQTPFRAATAMDTIYQVLHNEPVSPRRLQPKTPKDLETICLKCLEKNPSNRYHSARELADDIDSYLAGKTISARPVSQVTKAWRWCRRNPAGALAAAAVIVLFSVLVPAMLLFNLAQQKRQVAEAEATSAISLAKKETLLREAQEREAIAAKKARDEAVQREILSKQLAATEKYNGLLSRVRLRKLRRPTGWAWANYHALKLLANLAVRERDDFSLRCELASSLSAVDMRSQKILVKDFEANCVAFHPAGKLLAVAPHRLPFWFLPGNVLLVDLGNGRIIRKLSVAGGKAYRLNGELAPDGARSLAFDSSGKYLAVGMRSGGITCWNLDDADGAPMKFRVSGDKQVDWLRFNGLGQLFSQTTIPNDKELVAFRVVELWDISKNTRRAELKTTGAATFCLTPDGYHLIANMRDRLEFYDANTLKLHRTVASEQYTPWIYDVHPNGSLLAANQGEKVVIVSTDAPGQIVRTFVDPAHESSHLESRIEGVAFNKDGSVLLSYSSGTKDKTIKLWEVAGGKLHAVKMAGAKNVRCAVFHPSGKWIAVASDNNVSLYELFDKRVQTFGGYHSSPLADFGFLPRTGNLMCATILPSRKSRFSIWHLKKAEIVSQFDIEGVLGIDAKLALRPSGGAMVATASDMQKLSWQQTGRHDAVPFSLESKPDQFTFSSNGEHVWSITEATLSVRRWSDGKSIWGWRNYSTAGIPELNCLASGKTLVAVGARDGNVHLFTQHKPSWEAAVTGSGVGVVGVAFHPTGHYLAIGTSAGELRLIDARNRKTLDSRKESDAGLVQLSFSCDGRFLATAAQDNLVHVYLCSGEKLEPYFSFETSRTAKKLAFHPHNETLFGILVDGETAVRFLHLDVLHDHFVALGISKRKAIGQSTSPR